MDLNEGKKSKIAVSVVVPVYNAEKYLNETLSDIQKQTLKNIEVICVNDGSEDGSEEILKRFAGKDPRFHCLSQQHENAGAARNAGLQKARGNYVIFWDADDRFALEALEKLYRKAEERHADLCACGAGRFDEEGALGETDAYLKRDMLPEKDPFDKFDMPRYLFNFTTNVPWNKLYRREFLLENDICFQSIQQANDVFFTMAALYAAKHITYVDERLIRYRVYNRDSLTGKASETNLCPYEAFRYTLEKLKREEHFPLIRTSFQNRVLEGLLYALNIQTQYPAYREFYELLQKEGLELFGLDTCSEEDIYIPWQYRDLERLRVMEPEEYLHIKAFERRVDNEKIRQNANKLRNLLHKERTAGISYKVWRTGEALYRHTVKKVLDKF